MALPAGIVIPASQLVIVLCAEDLIATGGCHITPRERDWCSCSYHNATPQPSARSYSQFMQKYYTALKCEVWKRVQQFRSIQLPLVSVYAWSQLEFCLFAKCFVFADFSLIHKTSFNVWNTSLSWNTGVVRRYIYPRNRVMWTVSVFMHGRKHVHQFPRELWIRR